MLGVGLCGTESGSSSVSSSVENSQPEQPANALPCSNLLDWPTAALSVAQRTWARSCCCEFDQVELAAMRRCLPSVRESQPDPGRETVSWLTPCPWKCARTTQTPTAEPRPPRRTTGKY